MKYLLTIIMLFIAVNVFADAKISDLVEDTTPNSNSLFVVVDDKDSPTTNWGVTVKSMITATINSIDTSAELATEVSDETGSGQLVFGTSPSLTTPALGTPSALVGTNITGTGAGFTAGTATALAANGANCAAGSYPLGVDADGATESCTDATTEITTEISAHSDTSNAHHEKTALSIILTDIADGTITSDLVNTAFPWADNEVSDNLTIATITTFAASHDSTSGTLDSGTVANLQDHDAVYMEISEEVTTGIQYAFTFTSVSAFNSFVLFGRYDGSATHQIAVEVWNVDSSDWDLLGYMAHSTTDIWYTYPVIDNTHYISGGSEVVIQLRHVQAGTPTHDLFIDYLAIQYGGIGGGGVTDHGALSGLTDDDHALYMTSLETDASITVHSAADSHSMYMTSLETDASITVHAAVEQAHITLPLTHENGGLEADVSGYDGLVLITGGTTSYTPDRSASWDQSTSITMGTTCLAEFQVSYPNSLAEKRITISNRSGRSFTITEMHVAASDTIPNAFGLYINDVGDLTSTGTEVEAKANIDISGGTAAAVLYDQTSGFDNPVWADDKWLVWTWDTGTPTYVKFELWGTKQ